MAIFQRLSKEKITTMFTDKALFCGVVPVYINLQNPQLPHVAVRNWVPEWSMGAVEWLITPYQWLRQKFDSNYVPQSSFVITGPIEGAAE